MKTKTINGYEMSYEDAGSGVPLVLVHGALSDCRNWEPQMQPFGEHFHTYAISLRHCWPDKVDVKSGSNAGGYSIDQHVADLVSFIKSLDERVHLVGHSRGGQVAMRAAQQLLPSLRTLMLAEPVIGLQASVMESDPETERNALALREGVAKAAREVEGGDMEAAVRTFANTIGGPGAWEKRSPERQQIARDNAHTLPGLMTPSPKPIDAQFLKDLKLPVLLLNGEQTEPNFIDIIEAIEPHLPNVRRAIVSDAAHGMNRDNPGEFNRRILEFLKVRGFT